MHQQDRMYKQFDFQCYTSQARILLPDQEFLGDKRSLLDMNGNPYLLRLNTAHHHKIILNFHLYCTNNHLDMIYIQRIRRRSKFRQNMELQLRHWYVDNNILHDRVYNSYYPPPSKTQVDRDQRSQRCEPDKRIQPRKRYRSLENPHYNSQQDKYILSQMWTRDNSSLLDKMCKKSDCQDYMSLAYKLSLVKIL